MAGIDMGTPAGKPASVATRHSPCDSPAVSKRSIWGKDHGNAGLRLHVVLQDDVCSTLKRNAGVAHALEVAEKVGDRLPYGRGSESACRVYSHLLSRDRQGAVVLVLFQQPLQRAAAAFVPLFNRCRHQCRHGTLKRAPRSKACATML